MRSVCQRCARVSSPLVGRSPRIPRQSPTVLVRSSVSFRKAFTSSGPRRAELGQVSTEDIENNLNLPASTDLLEVYRGLVTTGRLRWDDEQVRCVMKLRDLLESLDEYSPPVDLLSQLNPSAPFRIQQKSDGSWWKAKGKRGGESDFDTEAGRDLIRVLTGQEELANLKTPKGILITGPPGTGKSLLLSLFFTLIPTTKKRRVHYHAFTLQLYRQVFKEMQRRREEVTEDGREDNRDVAASKGWRAVFAGGRWDTEGGQERRGWTKEDTIPFVIARDMILDYHVLYFDELQLVDASSAALLRDVLSWYWRLGGVIVSCSNRVPDDLYYHGIQRERMAGFLDALKSRCDVVELDGGRDWRRGLDPEKPIERAPTWYFTGEGEFDKHWSTAGGADASLKTLSVYSRPLHIPQAIDRTCRFTFAELCEAPLGPADYLSLASTFDTFFIDEVPILLLKAKNEARRLINLVDALYESRCQLYIRAAALPEELFFPDALDLPANQLEGDQILAEALSETLHAPARPNVSVYNYSPTQEAAVDASKGKVGAFSVLSIFTGEDERFAYKRAVSRLIEMTTSPTYPNEEWLPLGAGGRTWEGVISGSMPSKPFRSPITASEEDFAVEAGYSRPQRLTERHEPIITHQNEGAGPRHDPPIIKEEHVWGVADEWGEKAGTWGKGPKAYKKKGDGQ